MLLAILLIAWAWLIVCWVLWLMVFVARRMRSKGPEAIVTAPVARWGILLQGLGYALLWSVPRQPEGAARNVPLVAASMILAPGSVVLAWFAVKHLGRQWRIQAGLNADHKLVETGPYRVLRHPVYASMLGMFLATALVWTWWPLLAPALAAFLAGMEIRVRAEDRLLASRFGDSFFRYRARVKGYIPFVR